MPNYDLGGQVAVVTGAARGIGAGIAQRLAAEGGRMVLVDIDSERLAETAERLAEAGSEVLAVTADVSERGEVRRLFEQVEGRYGHVNCLVNNAAMIPP